MSSRFDMNQPPRLCNVCMEVHPITNPCKYDVLVKNIHTMKQNIVSILKANKEAIDTAKVFQQIIRDMTPNAERWSAIELEYLKLIAGLRGAAVHPFAPSTGPNKPAPLVGVSVDDINLLLPPDPVEDKLAFESWLTERNRLYEAENPLPKEEDQDGEVRPHRKELRNSNGPAKFSTET